MLLCSQKTYPYLESAIQNKTAPASIQPLERAILAKLRTMTLQEFANLPDVSEGLEHRLYKAAKTAVSLTDFYAHVKTKRYTHARIRRITLCAFLNVQAACELLLRICMYWDSIKKEKSYYLF